MDKSSEINELATALAIAQGNFPVVTKDSDNPFFKSKYADLAAIIEAIRKPLNEQGISVIQPVTLDAEKHLVTVTTMLVHKSGQYVCNDLAMPVLEWKAQAVGSAITYGRRYGAQAMFFLAAEDDDGNNASGKNWTNREEGEALKQEKITKLKAEVKPKAPPSHSLPGSGRRDDSVEFQDAELVKTSPKRTTAGMDYQDLEFARDPGQPNVFVQNWHKSLSALLDGSVGKVLSVWVHEDKKSAPPRLILDDISVIAGDSYEKGQKTASPKVLFA